MSCTVVFRHSALLSVSIGNFVTVIVLPAAKFALAVNDRKIWLRMNDLLEL
jgi:hypothetical protein